MSIFEKRHKNLLLVLQKSTSSHVVVALLSQCIMKIPGVFVNIDGGATRRRDVELNKETAALLCRSCLPYAWTQTIHHKQTSMK